MIILSLRILLNILISKSKGLQLAKDGKKIISDFRCWPLDCDSYLHLNNSSYFRLAELSRWRIHPHSGIGENLDKKKIKFLVSEQSARYFRSIEPFEKFTIVTSITTTDNKWLNYEHKFEQHRDLVKQGDQPKVYASVLVRAVLKEPNGKTMKINELLDISPSWFKKFIMDTSSS